jgi:hypothetical protein
MKLTLGTLVALVCISSVASRPREISWGKSTGEALSVRQDAPPLQDIVGYCNEVWNFALFSLLTGHLGQVLAQNKWKESDDI